MDSASAVADPPAGSAGEETASGSSAAQNGGGDGSTPPTPPADLGREPDPQPDDNDAPEGLFLVGDYEVDKKIKARKPDGARLKIKMVKADLGTTQFARGTRLAVTSIVQITGDHDDDSIETQTGEVHSTSKEQKATTLTIAKTEEWLASKIDDDDLLAKVCLAADLDLPLRLRDAA